MKIKKIVEKQREYQDLSIKIENIEKSLEDFKKQERKDSNTTYITGTLYCDSYLVGIDNEIKTETINVNLDGGIVKLIKPKLIKILKKELQKLEKERDLLEVQKKVLAF